MVALANVQSPLVVVTDIAGSMVEAANVSAASGVSEAIVTVTWDTGGGVHWAVCGQKDSCNK